LGAPASIQEQHRAVRGLLQLAIGLTVGFAACLALRGILPAGLAGIRPHDPVAVAAIAVLLTLIGLAACLVPARRAMRVDPVIALRAE
jgi:ABC-type antimicrobial peptide transport system permease subunit